MGIGRRIKESRLALNLSQEALGELVGVTGSAITNYEKEVSHPKESVLYKLMNVLNVDANYLFQDVIKPSSLSGNVLSDVELDFIKKYRLIMEDEAVRELFDNFINSAYDFSLKVKYQSKKPRRRELPIYNQPAAAGDGNFLTDESFDMVIVGDDVPDTATFGIIVSGDSMEPLINDGSTVWVRQANQIEHGRIGIFLLNGDSYIKQWDENNHSLISINKKYPPIVITKEDYLRVFGIVLIPRWT